MIVGTWGFAVIFSVVIIVDSVFSSETVLLISSKVVVA